MGCVEDMPYEVILSRASFAECREYVERHCPRYCHVDPGFRLFEKHIIGVPPIAIGLDGDVVIFPFTKPCYGTFLLRIEDPDEAARLARTPAIAAAMRAGSSRGTPQGPVWPRSFP